MKRDNLDVGNVQSDNSKTVYTGRNTTINFMGMGNSSSIVVAVALILVGRAIAV